MTKTAQGVLLSTVLATITACGSTKPANTGTGGSGGAGGTSSVAGSSGTAGSTATAGSSGIAGSTAAAGTMGSAGADAGAGTTGAAGSDAGSDAANDVPAQTDGGTTNIKAATGGTVTAAGLTVVIPAGALAADTDITVAVSDGVGLPGAATLVAKVYDLGPTGTTFLKPVSLAIDFDTAKVAAPKVATVAFLKTGAWVRLADSSTNGTKASATTTHFTPFSVVTADPIVQCGTAPYSPFAASIIAGGGATLPPSAHLRSNICGAGTFLDIPLTAGGVFQGQGTIYLQNTPQFLTATASDDSAFPFLSQEFTSLADAQIPLLTGLPFTLSAKTSALHPPGYGAGVGNASILIQLNKSNAAAPCDGDDGITISVVGSAHPEAIVYYVTSATAYSTTGPSVKGKENVTIILKPSSALEYVQIAGTKPSCSVDTGITATSNLRKLGFTGLIPIAPDSTTFAQASVAAP